MAKDLISNENFKKWLDFSLDWTTVDGINKSKAALNECLSAVTYDSKYEDDPSMYPAFWMFVFGLKNSIVMTVMLWKMIIDRL